MDLARLAYGSPGTNFDDKHKEEWIEESWRTYFQRPLSYDSQFPLAVFGTLRTLPRDQGNAQIMFRREPKLHCKAFLPHFSRDGITLKFEEGASAMFEVFFYDPQDFKVIIAAADQLEGFRPDHRFHNHWYRTLAELRVVPDDYAVAMFDEGIEPSSAKLDIPENEWDNFKPCMAWIYSNIPSNKEAARLHTKYHAPLPAEKVPNRAVFSNPIKWWR
jgi:hypothetical protein